MKPQRDGYVISKAESEAMVVALAEALTAVSLLRPLNLDPICE